MNRLVTRITHLSAPASVVLLIRDVYWAHIDTDVILEKVLQIALGYCFLTS